MATDRKSIRKLLTEIMGDFPTDHLLEHHADTIEALLTEREEEVCKYVTGDNRICRKETVKAIIDAQGGVKYADGR